MSTRTDKSKFEAVFKLKSWGSAYTCPTHYVRLYFDREPDMEAWVDRKYAIHDTNPMALYYTVTDLETGKIIYQNFVVS